MILRSTNPQTPDGLATVSYDALCEIFNSGKVIKEGERQRVRLCEIRGKYVVVKRYQAKGILASLRVLLGLSRPNRSLRYANYLRISEIFTPTHFLTLSNWSIRSAHTFLIIEYIAGPKLRDLVFSEDPTALKNQIVEAAIKTIQSFHALGLTHGDLHTENLIVKDDSSVFIIDLDNVQRSRRRQVKDIERLVAALGESRCTEKSVIQKIHTSLSDKIQ